MAEMLETPLSQLTTESNSGDHLDVTTNSDSQTTNNSTDTATTSNGSDYTDNKSLEDSQSKLDDEPSDESKDEKSIETQELEKRKAREDLMTNEEKEGLREKAEQLKASANSKYKQLCFAEAIEEYTAALETCPLCYSKERSILYSNRAAAYLYQENTEKVINDCTQSLQLNPNYTKPLLRRAQAYEKTEKLDEALEDYKKLLELDKRNPEAISACRRLPAEIEKRNEKLKAEMLGKLKDLGNLVLKPFGLSTNNFQLQQNDSGGYSVNFKQSN